MDDETIKMVQRILEDYVDDLRKSNDLWRKSQGEIADMILDKLQDIKTKIITIDREPAKSLIDDFEKDVFAEDEKPISKDRCVRLIKQMREIGV